MTLLSPPCLINTSPASKRRVTERMSPPPWFGLDREELRRLRLNGVVGSANFWSSGPINSSNDMIWKFRCTRPHATTIAKYDQLFI